jgi:ribulose-phosphate 3-epimerase
MKISASFLSIKNDLQNNIIKLDNTNIDYIHLDIMDNLFVPNKTKDINFVTQLLKDTKKPLDVHLMVSDIFKYIDDYKTLNPEFITFHIEAYHNPKEVIEYIKKNNIKVGISLKPGTQVTEIIKYLDIIDLVLIMSVEPGFGGQEFIVETSNKIKQIKQINPNITVSIDGGINDITVDHCQDADIIVVGSYITNSDNYQEQINKLKKEVL